MRNLLYLLARLLGDANAIIKGKVSKRIERRLTGRLAGKVLGKITKK